MKTSMKKLRQVIRKSILAEARRPLPDLIEKLQAKDPVLDKFAWYISLNEGDPGNIKILLDMGLGEDITEPGDPRTISTTVPGTEGQGVYNKQMGKNMAMGRTAYYRKDPEIGFEYLARMRSENPRAYKKLSKQLLPYLR